MRQSPWVLAISLAYNRFGTFVLAFWEIAMKTALRQLFLMSFLILATGCYNVQRRQVVQPQPAPPPYSQPGVIIKPGPVAPPPPPGMQSVPPQAGPTYTVPPQNMPPPNVLPPNAPPQNVPPAANVSPFPMVPPPSQPNTSGAYVAPRDAIAQVENRWQPVENGVKLGTPIALNENKADPRFYPPDRTGEPPLNAAATTLPVGIPQFAMAMDNVATGLRPSLDEGLDWLKARLPHGCLYSSAR